MRRAHQPSVQVAAAIILNQQEEILICRRGAGGSCAYLYEFPGGKREWGESLEDCLRRECREELNIEIAIGHEVYTNSHCYEERNVDLHFFLCRLLTPAEGIKSRVHTDLRWVERDELTLYRFCPADEELIELLIEGEIKGMRI